MDLPRFPLALTVSTKVKMYLLQENQWIGGTLGISKKSLKIPKGAIRIRIYSLKYNNVTCNRQFPYKGFILPTLMSIII